MSVMCSHLVLEGVGFIREKAEVCARKSDCLYLRNGLTIILLMN